MRFVVAAVVVCCTRVRPYGDHRIDYCLCMRVSVVVLWVIVDSCSLALVL